MISSCTQEVDTIQPAVDWRRDNGISESGSPRRVEKRGGKQKTRWKYDSKYDDTQDRVNVVRFCVSLVASREYSGIRRGCVEATRAN